jgi:hypothetical protein
MFETPEQVAAALKRYRDVYDPKTTSLIIVSNHAFDTSGDPFSGDFLSGMGRREELRRRLRECVTPRARHLLFLWYVADLPVSSIARRLKISRIHCYRLRKDALTSMCDDPDGGEEASGA